MAFVNFDGDPFTIGKTTTLSVCDGVNRNKRNAVQPIVKLVETDAKAIVLIYESSQRFQKAGDLSIMAAAVDLKSVILSERDIAIAKDEKRRLQQLRKVYYRNSYSLYDFKA